MQSFHNPRIDARYWLAITLASIFGTNMGDLYAHDSGLGIWLGLLVLAAFAAAAFVAERFDSSPHEAWYWLVIVIIRTGATNIADYLAFRVRIPQLILSIALALIIAGFGLMGRKRTPDAAALENDAKLTNTSASYWVAMLGAGVFGTVVGDVCSHVVGQGVASIGLLALLAVVLAAGARHAINIVAIYWLTVAVARTAGTAMGDWLAENKMLNIGLPLSTLITGCTFVAVLLLWRHAPRRAIG